jgi:hypothetical protein
MDSFMSEQKRKGEGFATDSGLQFLNGRGTAEKCNEENGSGLSLQIPSPILNVYILIKTPQWERGTEGGRDGQMDGLSERDNTACSLYSTWGG